MFERKGLAEKLEKTEAFLEACERVRGEGEQEHAKGWGNLGQSKGVKQQKPLSMRNKQG